MIKAVILDWGGVLIDNPTYGFARYCANQLRVSRADFSRTYKLFREDFQKGMIPENLLWKRICSRLGISEPETESLWKEAFKANYREKEDVFSLASSLHKEEYKIAVLSNTELPATELFYEKGYDFFDAVVFSCFEKARKPEKRIYDAALEKLDVNPREAVFIDDIAAYLEPAKKLGMKTILFKTPGRLRKELASILKQS